jgi:hypothetical protein
MFRVTQQTMRLAATLALLPRRWSYGRSHASYLHAACLGLVLAGAVAVLAICSLAGLLLVALLFMKGVIP